MDHRTDRNVIQLGIKVRVSHGLLNVNTKSKHIHTFMNISIHCHSNLVLLTLFASVQCLFLSSYFSSVIYQLLKSKYLY